MSLAWQMQQDVHQFKSLTYKYSRDFPKKWHCQTEKPNPEAYSQIEYLLQLNAFRKTKIQGLKY